MKLLSEVITELVEESQGIKMVELATRIVVKLSNEGRNVTGDDIINTIDEMEGKKELVVLGYVLPQMDYRLKRFILPKGTVMEGAL
jgi:hypothetical protein